MIRPFTLVCMVSAFGSGLYLYQSKHQAQVLDRDIARTVKQTEATRDRTGMLRAEWALLNEPDRLAELARAHTSLQTLKPTQFVALNDLAARLPAPAASGREKLPAEDEPDDAPAAPVAQVPPPVAAPAKPREVASVAEPKPKPDPKPVVRAVEKPPAARVQVAEVAAGPGPIHPRPAAEFATNDATAPGTVGAAVLRAMRAQNGGFAQAATTPAYMQPASVAPAPSVLGARNALPPPVPFAAR